MINLKHVIRRTGTHSDAFFWSCTKRSGMRVDLLNSLLQITNNIYYRTSSAALPHNLGQPELRIEHLQILFSESTLRM